ncbi:aldolase/citrate lyase family protein [Streptomyces diastatochromogenes]|nr:aldolase/citrate lyase family protein [Streptomyces diastatochromogenes]
MTPFPLTWLYVPGDRPHVVAKALAAGADVVVIDLEDAVAPDRKEYARAATAERLGEPQPVPVHVRVNALDGPWAAADLTALATLPGMSGLRLPKVTSRARSGRSPWPRPSPCTPCWSRPSASSTPSPSPPPTRPCGASPSARPTSGPTWAYGPTQVSTGPARGWSSPPARPAWHRRPVRPPRHPRPGRPGHLLRPRPALGFLGRAAIHPRQLPVIERAYLPTYAEIEAAETIIKAAATNEGAQALPDGRFVDAAVVAAAQRTLSLGRSR